MLERLVFYPVLYQRSLQPARTRMSESVVCLSKVPLVCLSDTFLAGKEKNIEKPLLPLSWIFSCASVHWSFENSSKYLIDVAMFDQIIAKQVICKVAVKTISWFEIEGNWERPWSLRWELKSPQPAIPSHSSRKTQCGTDELLDSTFSKSCKERCKSFDAFHHTSAIQFREHQKEANLKKTQKLNALQICVWLDMGRLEALESWARHGKK